MYLDTEQAATWVEAMSERPEILDVLREQFDFLADHADGCPDDCPHCARLAEIVPALLRPFEGRPRRR